MTTHLNIQIPCIFQNKVLTIKALHLQGTGESPEEALLECLKHTSYYAAFKHAKIIQGSHMYITIPYNQDIYNAILDIEPLPGTLVKTKQFKSFLEEPTPEQILKLGY